MGCRKKHTRRRNTHIYVNSRERTSSLIGQVGIFCVFIYNEKNHFLETGTVCYFFHVSERENNNAWSIAKKKSHPSIQPASQPETHAFTDASPQPSIHPCMHTLLLMHLHNLQYAPAASLVLHNLIFPFALEPIWFLSHFILIGPYAFLQQNLSPHPP